MTHSPQETRQPGSIAIVGFQQLSSFFSELQARPELAREIKALEYTDGEVIAVNKDQLNADMNYILEQITQGGQLECFKWYDHPDEVEIRPEAFWTALGNAADTLKHLSFQFAPHELSKLHDLTLFPLPFKELRMLNLDLSGGHGDDASQVHQMLHHTHKLTSLSLQLPGCDLENCRIRGITYDYHFPELESFSLHGWVTSGPELPDFLLRHPLIKNLCFSLSSDEEDGIQMAANAIPNLRALSINEMSRLRILSEFLASSTPRQIKYLRLESWKTEYLATLRDAGKDLQCLEMSTYNIDEWREDASKSPLRSLMPSLPELLEFTLDCPTGSTLWKNENGEWQNPEPIDSDDLRLLLSSFSSATTKIRAVGMKDHRGWPLPAEFLTDLSKIAPPSLEYIRWAIKGKPVLYKLERTADGRTEAKECEGYPQASCHSTEADKWTSESILNHVE